MVASPRRACAYGLRKERHTVAFDGHCVRAIAGDPRIGGDLGTLRPLASSRNRPGAQIPRTPIAATMANSHPFAMANHICLALGQNGSAFRTVADAFLVAVCCPQANAHPGGWQE
jgi:hypothetical protein